MTHFATLHLHITARCLYHCPHCSSDAGLHRSEDALTTDDVIGLIDQLRPFKTRNLDISGGDPLILEKEHLLHMISHASRNGLETSISTNGSRLTGEYAVELCEAGLHRIKLSLHGICGETHDAFTGVPGSFEKTLKAIRASKAASLEVWVNATVTPQNLKEMLKLPGLLDPLKVDLTQISSAVPSGRGDNVGAEYVFSEQELAQAITLMQRAVFGPDHGLATRTEYVFTNTMFPDLETPPFEGRYCNNIADRIVIDHKGNVIPCCLLPKQLRRVLGNIKAEPLSLIYNDDGLKDDPVFSALYEGHVKLRERLGYEHRSHNLCATCADMLLLLP